MTRGKRIDDGAELVDRERLSQECDRAVGEGPGPQFGTVHCGHDDDRRRVHSLLESSQYLEPVDVGKADVKEDEVRGGCCQAVEAIRDPEAGMAAGLQRERDRAGDSVVVFDEQMFMVCLRSVSGLDNRCGYDRTT